MPFPCNLISLNLHKALIEALLIDKALNFLGKTTYGELLLTLLTQQTKAEAQPD